MKIHYLLSVIFLTLIFGGCTTTSRHDTVSQGFQKSFSDGTLITQLVPGMSMRDALNLLEQNGIMGAAQIPSGKLIFETVVFDEFFQRQRLVLVQTQEVLRKSVVIIDFEDVGNLDTQEQVFARVLNVLTRHYGRPDYFYERGNDQLGRFSTNLVRDIGNQQFVRIYQWDLTNGALMFGIPRRLDRQVRMEIHFSHPQDVPAFGDTLWSVEDVF